MFDIGEAHSINTVVTSKAEILKACREIVAEQGLAAVNMRAVAKRCGIALGSLYYYFPSKDELVLETIESVWQSIFHMESGEVRPQSFPDTVAWIFDDIRGSMEQYPNFFTTHSLGFASGEKDRAKRTMDACLSHIRAGMGEALRADPAVRGDAFSPALSEAAFLDFVLSSVVGLLLQGKTDCAVLLEVIRRAIY